MKVTAVLVLLFAMLLVWPACNDSGNSPTEPEDPSDPGGQPPDTVSNMWLATQAEGRSLRIIWEAPSGVVDGYRVVGAPAFDPDANASGNILCDEADTTYGSVERTYYSVAAPRYGCYHVYAFNEHGESHNAIGFTRYDRTFEIMELHSPQIPRFIGWGPDRPPGMIQSGDEVDLYLTNFAEGHDTGPYYLAAPVVSQYTFSDDLEWDFLRATRIVDLGTDPVDFVTLAPNAPQSVEIQAGHYYGTQNHVSDYAVVYVESIDIANGSVQLRAWTPNVTMSSYLGLVSQGL